jgi:hypothetical protein
MDVDLFVRVTTMSTGEIDHDSAMERVEYGYLRREEWKEIKKIDAR